MTLVTVENFKIGATVKRGPDWEWHDQDSNSTGTLVELDKDNPGWCSVNWTESNTTPSYRIGYLQINCKSYYDLEYVDEDDLESDLQEVFKD